MIQRPPYYANFDIDEILKEHPIGDQFIPFFSQMSRDELHNIQEERFLKCVKRAWEIPFYQRLWSNVGLEKKDIRTLSDIGKIPTFDKSDLMKSIEDNPPFGDFSGTDLNEKDHTPVIMHTTSGTTGTPQVLLFSPKTREIQNLLVARAYLFQGMSGSDVVHSIYGHGMVNAGHYMREAVTHYTNAIFCSAGTGVETRSVQQIHIMKRFGATIIVGFVDYLKRLAQVALEEGVDIGKDIPIRIISGHFGREDRAEISRLWGGAECFDWYGVGDTGIICSEGPDHRYRFV
jgi:phenylacetate-CoA ligase